MHVAEELADERRPHMVLTRLSKAWTAGLMRDAHSGDGDGGRVVDVEPRCRLTHGAHGL